MSTEINNPPQQKSFVIMRLLDAPCDLVFKAWTEREHMEWWGPKGIILVTHKMDLRPGGIFHYCMRTPDGGEMWGKWVIREVVKPERLVFVSSFSDAAGGITQHPMSPTWPREVLSTITFTGQSGGTLLSVEWIPINASDVERKAFDEGHESMQKGWGGTLDKLVEYLAELKR